MNSDLTGKTTTVVDKSAYDLLAADNAALRADLQEAVKWIPNGILHSANPRLSAIYNRLNAALKEKP